MLKIIAALVLGAAILLPTAAALAAEDRADSFYAPVQTEPLYLGPINAPVQVDTVNDKIRDHDGNG